MPEAMVQALLLAGALGVCLLGCAWLALAMDVHWVQVRGGRALGAKTQSVLRVLGALAITGSLLLCLRADHPGMAALVWIMALALAAMMVAFTLSWRPRVLAPLVAWVKTAA